VTKRSLVEFLRDILEAIADIESFTQKTNFQTFRANREKVFATVKLLEIVGEAVKKIPDEQRANHPNVPWKSVAGMRDILVHEYWQIDEAVVWATVQESIPQLKETIQALLRQEESSI
jgi:uncharacterized protein with HEPN domain